MYVSGTPVLLMHAEGGVGGLGGGGFGGGGGGGRGGDDGVDEPERTALHFRCKSREVATVACAVGDVVYCTVVSWPNVSSTSAIHRVRLSCPVLSPLLYRALGNALLDDFVFR